MKTCACTQYFAIYPCGHKLTTWEYCGKAKAKGLLKLGPPIPCSTRTSVQISPDLEDTCGSTCLTMPFQCSHCGASKQLGWKCSRCKYLRNRYTLAWSTCTCRKHNCLELGLGTFGKALCEQCRTGACTQAPGTKPKRPHKDTPLLFWKCHKCSRKHCTPATSMKCGGPGLDGCGHARCGDCRALFECNCRCSCTFHFVEGGPNMCEWCAKSCST
ncbi:hypothetical protein F5Y13DRAFT_174630 [Hypoxylon sp. FL1857]|nr:hypothetical protein F5Y13DRAFT_174630 [Hypoxylon sp. FL1857]